MAELLEILKDKDTLNLDRTEKRLILKALIKSKWNVSEAWVKNCEGMNMTYETYRKLVTKHFPIGIKNLKEQYRNERTARRNQGSDGNRPGAAS